MAVAWIKPIGRMWPVMDPWLMGSYHGTWQFSFPQHPHHGFETVTLVLPGTSGFVDHADSAGNAGRYGAGDVQWLTAGRGIMHSEVAVAGQYDPRPDCDEYNPEGVRGSAGWLMQLWLNLPEAKKMAPPTFKMFWRDAVPVVTVTDSSQRRTTVRVIAGSVNGTSGLPPPPDSWASQARVSCLLAHLEPDAEWVFERPSARVNSVFYVFGGDGKEGLLMVGESRVPMNHAIALEPPGSEDIAQRTVRLRNAGSGGLELLILEGEPINEPVVWRGPFVTTDAAGMVRAHQRYSKGDFGEWTMRDGPVFPGRDRFASVGGVPDEPTAAADFSCGWPADPSLRVPKTASSRDADEF